MLFCIVGRSEPLYEADLDGAAADSDATYLHQFILHSSLDLIQNAMWSNASTFLRTVDRFNSQLVSAYVTPGGAILLLLHQGKGEDAVRHFFMEVHENYTKHMLNPFSLFDAPITSPQFDSIVRSAARRLLL
jgi:hypothetical protein